jgi:hypothetical protein
MTDRTFGEIEFRIDAWDGVVSFDFATAGTTTMAVHVWSDLSGPTDAQIRTFEQLQAYHRSGTRRVTLAC